MSDQLDSRQIRQLQSAVLRWYESHCRELPWRSSANPYRIWISEIMLQQTTVATVVPYFDRFMSRFPELHDLAAAEQDEVLRYWEGLGYYSRARNLHRAARMIVGELSGKFPDTADGLQLLPGIGRYTAGAIASFAFNQPAPILEANTIRLFARLLNLQLPAKSAAGQKILWAFAAKVVSPDQPASFNQAAMDIGATICTPRSPQCAICPLSRFCRAFHNETQDFIPLEAPRAAITAVTEVSIAIRKGTDYLLRQRRADEWWSGLWDFARFRISDESAKEFPGTVFQRSGARAALKNDRGSAARQKLLFGTAASATNYDLPEEWSHQLQVATGLRISSVQPLTELRHSVTRYRIRLLCFAAEISRRRLPKDSEFRWFSTHELASLPLSQTGRKQAQLLMKKATDDT